ncbi:MULTISPECIES: phage tail terminator-like protein [unclassified Pseudomonas]|uniref:phage tail terminator-like protein n=1 Tax=unclassified Pseudomonas TaxID=196821 RepID=UPI000BDCA1DC|nr:MULTISPECIES: phage tail terminator-like protein [unclassified Pseudomonas]PVZ19924.1 uncharacterized protein DUF4128 [Pseudomonas sp. URIL14HWK12:I12]PVZ26990.1 uncharacterized protein DUF4128 [Pseudomonas sp. URIL14HWK12:I10]PVZ37879.1 uncharacterized protein DUF4128 [Pseudomonas sp. URIL14HWK12:I11]SNZ05302.1 Bacteriophage related protein of unknown function [Pseudomonas sp. URIL14HWK12:I9]
MSHKIIRSLLESRLAAWAAARSPALRVAYQNVDFSPADGETYLQAYLLPSLTASNTLGGDHRLYTGTFQVNVITPTSSGEGPAESIVVELADLFPVTLRLARGALEVLVLTPVSQGPVVPNDTTQAVSASFSYRADTE